MRNPMVIQKKKKQKQNTWYYHARTIIKKHVGKRNDFGKNRYIQTFKCLGDS